MATLTDYTSKNEVRAALGVSTKELKDAQLDLPMYVSGLLVNLNAINSGLNALYVSLKDAPNPSDSQKTFIDAVKLYSAYAVASQVSPSLALLAVKSITDGKAAIDRFSGSDPTKAVKVNIQEKLAEYRQYLLDTYLALVPGAATSTSGMVVGIRASIASVNPVLGE